MIGYSLKEFVKLTNSNYKISPTWITDGHLAVRRDRFDVKPSENAILLLRPHATFEEITDESFGKVLRPAKVDDVAFRRTDIVFTAERTDIRLYFCEETRDYFTIDRKFTDYTNNGVLFKNRGVSANIRGICRTEDESMYLMPYYVSEKRIKELTSMALHFNSLEGTNDD